MPLTRMKILTWPRLLTRHRGMGRYYTLFLTDSSSRFRVSFMTGHASTRDMHDPKNGDGMMATTIEYIIRPVTADIILDKDSTAETIDSAYLADSEEQQNASSTRFELSFKTDDLPPVEAFWSLTMRDRETHRLITNDHDQYQLNSSTMGQFKLEEDGSFFVHIAKESPGGEHGLNWLSAPDEPFYLVLRLYEPKLEALRRNWKPPRLMSVHTSSPLPDCTNSAFKAAGTKNRIKFG